MGSANVVVVFVFTQCVQEAVSSAAAEACARSIEATIVHLVATAWQRCRGRLRGRLAGCHREIGRGLRQAVAVGRDCGGSPYGTGLGGFDLNVWTLRSIGG
jgi:hypothetical protein